MLSLICSGTVCDGRCTETVIYRYPNGRPRYEFKQLTLTSNVTAVTEVRSASARLSVCGDPWWVLLQHYYVAIIFHRRVWHRALSLRVFDKIKVRASSSSPRLPLCQISFLSRLHCWASPQRKSRTQSLTQLRPIWCPGNLYSLAVQVT